MIIRKRQFFHLNFHHVDQQKFLFYGKLTWPIKFGRLPKSSFSVGFIPMALMAHPSSVVLMVPPPSTSNSLKACSIDDESNESNLFLIACFNSATCSSDNLSAIIKKDFYEILRLHKMLRIKCN